MVYKNKAGKRMPSVTTIIGGNLGWNKQVLLKWYAKEFRAGRDPEVTVEKACNTGTLVHAYVEADVTGVKVVDEVLKKYSMDAILIAQAGLEQWIKLKEENEIEIDLCERGLVSEKYQYGGCIDLGGKVKKRRSLLDIKTSRDIYADHIIQMGGYDNLLIENDVFEPEDYYFVSISKDPTKEEDEIIKLIKVETNTIKTGFEVFKQLRWLHSIQKELKIK